MPTIDQILLLLTDNQWHDLDEIAQKVALPYAKLEKVVNFLTEYDFIHRRQNPKKVKLKSQLLKFLTEIQQIEQETVQ